MLATPLLAVEVHRVGQPDESFESVVVQVLSLRIARTMAGETIGSRRASTTQRIALEERNDVTSRDRTSSVDREGTDTVAVRSPSTDTSASEHSTRCFEHRSMPLVLVDVERRGAVATRPVDSALAFRCTETEKQPSPSTNPTTQCGSSIEP